MQAFAQTENPYFAQRPDGDINLVTEVRNLLLNNGIPTAAYDQHQLIQASMNKASSVQRFNLNRYWSLQLMATEKYSEEERYCLIPNGSNEEWLKLFEAKVLPFALANGLPRII